MKKLICLLLVVALAMALLAGCGSDSDSADSQEDTVEEVVEEETQEEAEEAEDDTDAEDEEEAEEEEEESAAETRIIQDTMGNDVEVPMAEDLNSMVITSFKGAFNAAIILGVADRVTGMASTTSYQWLFNAFPELAEIKDYGSFSNVNMEELLQDEPDVVISPETSEDANESMRELGLAVAVDGYSDYDSDDVFVECYAEIDLVATLTGTEDVAERYYEWADSIYDMVAERVADIPDEERVRVVPMRTDENEVFCNNYICGYIVEMAGGINLTGDLNGGSGDFYVNIDAEQLLELDPDMIFKINFYGDAVDENLGWYEELAADERYSDITAIKNGDFYLVPVGIDYWDAATEAPLGVLWMAKIMYPDLFEDVDVKQVAADYYEEFLGYTLTEDDWELLAPQFDGANYNGLYGG